MVSFTSMFTHFTEYGEHFKGEKKCYRMRYESTFL